MHKYQKQMAFDTTRKRLFRLFNPRQDEWEMHFGWNRTTTRMIGRTAIGRTTIGALHLNSERQIEARILWQHSKEFSG